MILNLNNNEDLKEVFDALEEAFVNTGIDYFLIGAQARDHWYQKGGKTSRQTRDVDIAVLVGSQEEYNQVRHYLEEHKSYQGTKDNSFVMITPGRIQVDILPFGEIEIDDAVVMAGEGLTSIKVNGFMEVYKTGTHSIELGEGRIFKVATLPAIILLKFVAYDDRPEKRSFPLLEKFCAPKSAAKRNHKINSKPLLITSIVSADFRPIFPEKV